MNLQHLRYFLTLADLEHYTDAAKKLHITQPTLSHAINMLEEQVKARLFIKQGRNVVLTKEGKSFYETVQNSLSILDAGIEQLQNQKTTTIHLTLLRVLGRKAVPNLVRRFLNAHPESHVNFDFANDSGMSSDLIDGVMNNKYDLAFCSKLKHYPSISFIPIFSQDMVLIVPKHHPLADKQEVNIADTMPFPQVWFSKRSGMRPVVEDIYRKEQLKPTIAFEVSEDETVAGLVAQGFGIALIPRLDFLDKIEDITILDVPHLKNARIYYAAYRNDKPLSAELMTFIDYITNISADLDDIN